MTRETRSSAASPRVPRHETSPHKPSVTPRRGPNGGKHVSLRFRADNAKRDGPARFLGKFPSAPGDDVRVALKEASLEGRWVLWYGESQAVLAWEAEKHVRGVQPLPAWEAEKQVRRVQPLPAWEGEKQVRGVQPLPAWQVEKQLRGVQPLPARQAETQLRGVQPLSPRQAQRQMRRV